MIKNLKQLYALAVCIVCSLVLIICIGFGFTALLSYATPRHMINHSYRSDFDIFESNEKFIESFSYNKERTDELKKLPVDKLTAMRLSKREAFLVREKGNAIHSLLRITPWMLTALIFFFIHWHLYRRFSEKE